MVYLAFLRFSSSSTTDVDTNPPPSSELSSLRPHPKLRPLDLLTKLSRRASASPTDASPIISRPKINTNVRPLPSKTSPIGGTPPTLGGVPARTPPNLPLYPFPIAKSASLPTTSTSSHFYPPPPRFNPKLHINTQNLSRNSYAGPTDVRRQDDWSRYPIARHLSPIPEQEYVSPASLLDTVPLPGSGQSTTPKAAISILRKESQRTDITRPSPVYSQHQAFISRPLNRSISQASSIYTPRSISSSTPISAATSASAPTIPPIDLTPAFPGPHRANTLEGGPTRRVPPSPLSYVSSATDWENSRYASEQDAQSFRTASESRTRSETSESDREAEDFDIPDTLAVPSEPAVERQEESVLEPASPEWRSDSVPPAMPAIVTGGSVVDSQPASAAVAAASPLSNTSSFIYRRWDRIRLFEESPQLCSGALALPRVDWKRWTPASLLFWLGFCFPLLWLFGGWYFTIYQETGMTWAALVQQEHRYEGKPKPPSSRKGKAVHGGSALLLPLWAMHGCRPPISGVTEEERRSVQKLYLGYPFVNREFDLPQHIVGPQDIHAGPFRLLSKIPIVRISLLGSDEDCSTRRKLDPWIWRCRVAFMLFGISSIMVCITLIGVYLPRAL